MPHWTASDIPSQRGTVAVVTGANSGLGYETSLGFARAGAHVVMACRDEERGREALGKLRGERDVAGSAELMTLDLADLDSVRAFAKTFLDAHDRLDLLVDNAGVMVPPERATAQGFELQWGVNVVGHFALTGLLLERLLATAPSRVVTVSSIAHRGARIDFDNLRGEREYDRWREYGQSKLANLAVAIELQRRLDAADVLTTLSVAAHPGFTATGITRHDERGRSGFLSPLIGQTPAAGALPILYAATADEVEPGGYYGPDGLLEIRGGPAPAKVAAPARDPGLGGRLWAELEAATGVRARIGAAVAA